MVLRTRTSTKARRRRRPRALITLVCALALLFGGGWAVADNPSIGRPIVHGIDQITGCTSTCLTDRYMAWVFDTSSLSDAGGVYDINSGDYISYWKKDDPVLPASVEKLFSIAYSMEHLSPGTVVRVSSGTLALTPPDSSTARLTPGHYRVRDLYAGMLVPSGNDAAYALAVATARRVHHRPDMSSSTALATFARDVTAWAHRRGYNATTMTNPAGFSNDDRTSVEDVTAVTTTLLRHGWFQRIVSSPTYTVHSAGGRRFTWRSTNHFLDPGSDDYDSCIKGVKTGSLSGHANLVALYRGRKSEYLVMTFGSHGDSARYHDIRTMLDELDANGR